MTICIVWLLTYVGQVLDLAVENRPMSIAHARHGQDYHHEVGGVRKHQNEFGSIAGNLLHLKTYPYEGSHHRDDLSEWLVYNEKQPIYSWTPSGMLVDELMKEPKDLQAVFLALSPGLSNVLYPEYVAVTSPHVSVGSMSRTTGEPLVDDALLAQHQHRYQRQHQQQQQQHHQQQQQRQQYQHSPQRQLHQRNKKRRIIDYANNKHRTAESQAVGLPILIYDNGEKTLPDNRQSDREDVYEQRLNLSPIKSKTEPIYERVSKPLSSISSSPSLLSSSSSSASSSSSSSSSSSLTSSSASSSSSREFQSPGGFASSKSFIYETNDPSEKRNQITVGRRSVDLPGEPSVSQHQPQTPPTSSSSSSSSTSGSSSIPSQFMLRSIRANRQYDVPQIECPASEEGMERFACPSADRMGRYRCIDDHVLCDGFIDCPSGEDEDRQACMFYKTTRAHLDVLADAILRWARGR